MDIGPSYSYQDDHHDSSSSALLSLQGFPIVVSNNINDDVPAVDVATSASPPPHQQPPSRYESQKRRDWNTFNQYLGSHGVSLPQCGGPHVIQFLRYLDQFGKTRVHSCTCPFFGQPNPPAPCPCPLKQAWGSLDALVGRLRAAFDENGGLPEANPFGARGVRIYLKEVRDHQSKARGVSYDKKKKKKQKQQQRLASSSSSSPQFNSADIKP